MLLKLLERCGNRVTVIGTLAVDGWTVTYVQG